MKKISYLFLLPVFLMLFAPACADAGNADTSSAGPGGGLASPEATETEKASPYEDDLPEMDYGGEPFYILHFPSYINAHGYLWTAEETGDVINDAVYRANCAVEERFNLAFEEIVCPNYSDVPPLLKKSVSSGDGSYDYLMMADRDAFALAMEGKFYHNIDELPHVDLDKPYWNQSLRSAVSINKKLYFAYGSNMLSVNDFTSFLLFNKKIAEELALDNIYQLVREGKWTMDRMREMAASAALDVNGNGKMDDGDRYGISIRADYFYASFWVCDRVPMVGKDENDMLYFNVPGNDKLFRIFDKLHEFATSDYIWDSKGGTDPAMEMFSNGQALFFSTTTYTTLRLRGMEIDYGIIPYPTLEEKKPGEAYSGRAQSGLPVLIPVTSDPARGSAVMEALACQFQKSVIPAYYENAVQIKATRDEDSIEMIDMLMTNKFLDLGDTLWIAILRNEYTDLFAAKKGDTVQSLTEKITPKVEETLQKAMSDFQNAGG